MSKKAAIVLCGCGSRDGSEIHESVCTLLAVAKNGAQALCYAPGASQARVVNHVTGKEEPGDERNMLVEAARITRGNIQNILELTADSADALIFPGGLGAAFNLFTYAQKGLDCSVHPEAERVINEFFAAHKPIGFICISPMMGARVLGKHGIELTIGHDPEMAQDLAAMGAKHIEKQVDEIHIDRQHKIVSTPAYNLATNIVQVDAGISKLVEALLVL